MLCLLAFLARECAPLWRDKWGPCPHVCFVFLRFLLANAPRCGAVSGDPAPTYVPNACDLVLLPCVSTFLRGRTPRPPVTAYGRRCAHKLQGSICPVCLRLWRSSLASFFRLRGPSLASLGIPKPKKGCVYVVCVYINISIFCI